MMKKKQPATLRAALVGALVRSVAFTLCGVGGFLIVSMFATPAMQVSPTPPAVERPAAEGAPSTVLDRMGDKCWTGEAPADMQGVIPGHVVYAKGDTGALVGGPVMVGKALDQIFADRDFGLTIYAFCK